MSRSSDSVGSKSNISRINARTNSHATCATDQDKTADVEKCQCNSVTLVVVKVPLFSPLPSLEVLKKPFETCEITSVRGDAPPVAIALQTFKPSNGRTGAALPTADNSSARSSFKPKMPSITVGSQSLTWTHPGHVVPRAEILEQLWGYPPRRAADLRVVDVYVARLRGKLEPDPRNPELILTVRGIGYSSQRVGEVSATA